jgi:hypothetical protein
MAITAGEVILRARRLLADDVEPFAWSPEQMLGFVNDAEARAYSLASHWFLDETGAAMATVTPAEDADDALTIDGTRKDALGACVVWLAMLEEDPDNKSDRADKWYGRFVELLG